MQDYSVMKYVGIVQHKMECLYVKKESDHARVIHKMNHYIREEFII